jgi:hypothetical protein
MFETIIARAFARSNPPWDVRPAVVIPAYEACWGAARCALIPRGAETLQLPRILPLVSPLHKQHTNPLETAIFQGSLVSQPQPDGKSVARK